jgi:DNA-binding CsgD family transcriptional regulator
MELLRRIANGATYVQLAHEWHLAELSVRAAGSKVLRKLGANHITHAVFLACQAGLLDGKPRRHGDHAGFTAHLRRGEEPCEPCWDGERAYRRAGKATRKAAARNAE